MGCVMRLFAIVALLILAVPSVAAVGITSLPRSERTLLYEPGRTFTFELAVRDADEITVYALGDFAESVAIDDPNPGGGPRRVTVHITHPLGVEPGEYVTLIGAKEGAPSGGMVAARAEAQTGFITRVMGPEKNVRVGLSVPSVNLGEVTIATVSVQSWTTSDIARVWAILNVSGPNGEHLGTFTSETVPLPSSEKVTLEMEIPTEGYPKGYHNVTSTVTADELIHHPRTSFRVGTLEVVITNVTRTYYQDMINPLYVTVASDWNGEIEDVYATVRVADERIKTPNLDITEFAETNLPKAYFDTSGLELGEYPATVTLFYQDQQAVLRTNFTVIERPPDVGSDGALTFSPLLLLYVAVILLVMANIYLLFFRKQGRGKQE